MRYQKGTQKFGLVDDKARRTLHELFWDDVLRACCDPDRVSITADRRSTRDMAIFIVDGIVFWKTQKQDFVAFSSSEAE